MSEYVRFLEGSTRDFSRPPTIADRLHIDLALLVPIVTLTVMGMFVLFSAADGDWNTIARQAAIL